MDKGNSRICKSKGSSKSEKGSVEQSPNRKYGGNEGWVLHATYISGNLIILFIIIISFALLLQINTIKSFVISNL